MVLDCEGIPHQEACFPFSLSSTSVLLPAENVFGPPKCVMWQAEQSFMETRLSFEWGKELSAFRMIAVRRRERRVADIEHLATVGDGGRKVPTDKWQTRNILYC